MLYYEMVLIHTFCNSHRWCCFDSFCVEMIEAEEKENQLGGTKNVSYFNETIA